LPFERVRSLVFQLVEQMDRVAPDEFKCLLKCAVPEYQAPVREMAPSMPCPGEARLSGEAKDSRNGRRSGSEPELEEPFHRIANVDAPK